MSEFKSYEEYKIVGLPWLESIPIHWKMTRNKNVLKLKKEVVGQNHTQYKLLSLTKQGIIYREMENAKGKFPKEFDTYQVVNPNDIVFCLFDIDETPRTIGLSNFDGMITGAYDVFRIENISKRYIYYYYLNLDITKKLKPLYTGLRKVINVNTFLRTKMPLPPKAEQDQIAKFLDNRLSKINRFIRVKEKQIKLLREKIEYQLFFNEPKEYPVIKVWEESFPSNWKMAKAKHIFNEINIKNCPNKELLAVTQDRGVMQKKNLEEKYMSPSGDLNRLKLVREYDYIISLRSFQGGIEFSYVEGIVSPAYNVFCLKKKYSCEEYRMYYKYLFKTRAFISLLNTIVSGIRDGKNISYSDFSQIMLPIPPLSYLRNLMNDINILESMTEQFKKEEVLLKEYRTSLISAVVTGRVDVRHIPVEDTDEFIADMAEDEGVFEEEIGEGTRRC
jgi:type I restriction enzyme S subunit